jgi:hypothetical protein
MLLPGGVIHAGERRRRVTLRAIDGRLELLIAEARAVPGPFQKAVSRVLAGAVEEIEGEALPPAAADQLCVADRQFLMHRIACALGLGRQWLTATCEGCEKSFDVEVDFDALPVRPAGVGFPYVTIETAAGTVRARVPTGADQASVVEVGSAANAERELARRCIVEGPVTALSGADLELVEEALENVSPLVVTWLGASCPECGHAHAVRLDPNVAMNAPASRLLDEVHSLAWHYHWSEREILRLPRERRRYYLSRIDRARGLSD